MSLQPPPFDRWRRPARWLLAGALFGLMPKCLLCVAAYTTAGAALTFGGSELCGAPAPGGHGWLWLLPGLGAVAGIVCSWIVARLSRP